MNGWVTRECRLRPDFPHFGKAARRVQAAIITRLPKVARVPRLLLSSRRASPMSNSLENAIRDKSALVGVIGLGYVGLPLINAFVSAGFRTLGFDVDQRKVDSLNAGASYIKHVDSKVVSKWRKAEQFEATADMARLAEADALLICVPTPLNDSRDPDLIFVEKTAEAIGKALRPGQLVILESTTYPNTTRDGVLPIFWQS